MFSCWERVLRGPRGVPTGIHTERTRGDPGLHAERTRVVPTGLHAERTEIGEGHHHDIGEHLLRVLLVQGDLLVLGLISLLLSKRVRLLAEGEIGGDDVPHSLGQEGADRAQHVPGVEAERGTSHVLGLLLVIADDLCLVQCIGGNIY